MKSDMYEEILKKQSKKNLKKRLEISIPIVKTYNNIAFPMSIICCRNINKDWFYSNFINIYSYYNSDINKLEVNYDVQFFEDEVYYLNREKISIDTLDTLSSTVIDKFIQLINREKYICIFLDEFYIEETINYQKKHFDHEFMIYGYDSREKKFDCLYYGDDFQYRFRKVSYDSISCGYMSEKLNRDLPMMVFSYYKDNEWYRPIYALDIEYIKYSIGRYLKGVNFLYGRRHINPLNSNIINRYGISVYKDLINYINKMKHESGSINLICFYLFYEHKQCMAKRLYYLYEKGIDCYDLCMRYNYVSVQSRIVVNMLIKYNMKKEKGDKERESYLKLIQDKIIKIIELEKEVLSDFLDKV